MDAATPPVFDWSSFKKDDVYKLGLVDNWPELRRILGPLASPDFGVVDASLQALIDKVRLTLDLSMGPLEDLVLKSNNIVEFVSNATVKENPSPVLELVLAAGADPDMPNGFGWRPSHNCGYYGHLDVASTLFFCRPDMTAKTPSNKTPLETAESPEHGIRETHPMRRYVAKFIKDGSFEVGFPTLAELAVQKKWIPMKNLLRRQVVKEPEFTELLGDKTAADWAEYLQEPMLAKEIRYYHQEPARIRTLATASCLLQLEWAKSSSNKKDVKQLKAEIKKKDEKIADLSEAVAILKSKLDGVNKQEGGLSSAKKARTSMSASVTEVDLRTE